MFIEYWIACHLGRLWLMLRRILHLRPVNEGLPEQCLRVARGEVVPASILLMVQDFAVRVWWRAGMAAILLVFPVIAATAALNPGRSGTDVGVAIIFALACIVGIAGAQVGVIRYRSHQTMRRVGTGGKADVGQLVAAAGRPRKADFWVMSALSLGVCAILIYAGTRSSGHG
jgi:hypothetical protein